MYISVIAALVLICASFQNGGTEYIEDKRSVTLGISYVYSDSFEEWRSPFHMNISVEEYLSLSTRMAEKAHFGNITCTNISFVFMGANKLNKSYEVEEKYFHHLDAKATLENLIKYAATHSAEFRHPDLTVLVTPYTIMNRSECEGRAKRSNTTISSNRLLSALCKHSYGASYFGSMCGNHSVAILTDDGRRLYAATELARQILNMMGILSDALRNKSSGCYNRNGYVSSSGWLKSSDLKYPGLSSCADRDLVNYIDSMSNSSNICWKDVPNATTTNLNLTPDNLFDQVDVCTWTPFPNIISCRFPNASENPDATCHMPCCNTNGEEENYSMYNPGKSCGQDGVCFARKCYQKTQGVA